jgi:tyrosinase
LKNLLLVECWFLTFLSFLRLDLYMKFLSILLAILISSLVMFHPVGSLAFADNETNLSQSGSGITVEYPYQRQRGKLDRRKSVSDLTLSEKKALVRAIKKLKTTIPAGSQISIYDQFVAVHLAATRLIHNHKGHPGATITDLAHENPAFLPWHRAYIRRFERELQRFDTSVTLPYWDWSDRKALDILFQDNFMSPNGRGVTIEVPGQGRYTGGIVQSGVFSSANGWVLDPRLNINPETERSLGMFLTRFLQVPPARGYPLSKKESDRILALDDYAWFRTALEGFIQIGENGQVTRGGFTHNYIHGLVGGVKIVQTPTGIDFQGIGTLSNIPSSPYDPIFWLVHSNVDRLWAQWQEKGHAGSAFYPAKGLPMGQNLNDPMFPWDGGMAKPEVTKLGNLSFLLPNFDPKDLIRPIDVLDHKKLGYTYVRSSSFPKASSVYGLVTIGLFLLMFRSRRRLAK